MAAHDRDASPRVEGTLRYRTMVGIYYHEEPFPEGGETSGASTAVTPQKKRK
jgi:hypothetical protein